MNKVILIGRLTKDPDLRYTPANGVAVATFTLAVDRPFLNHNGEREADFIPIVVWRKLAETCAQHLKKGRLVGVSGMIQTRSYETQEGNRRWVTEVVADEIQFLDKPTNGNGNTESKGKSAIETEEGQEPEFEDVDFDVDFDFNPEEFNFDENNEEVPF